MIGLVLVSHSARLAEGVAELAAQMAGPDVRIAAAGGLDQPGSPLGTDAALVAAAIERAWSPDGVLVLMDLGSAVLSAELALDLLPDGAPRRRAAHGGAAGRGSRRRRRGGGAGRVPRHVAGEARGGLAAKAAAASPREASRSARLASPARSAPRRAPRDLADAGAGATLRLVVANPLGLHARPAALPGAHGGELRRRRHGRRPDRRAGAGERPQPERRRHPGRGARPRDRWCERARAAGRRGAGRHRPAGSRRLRRRRPASGDLPRPDLPCPGRRDGACRDRHSPRARRPCRQPVEAPARYGRPPRRRPAPCCTGLPGLAGHRGRPARRLHSRRRRAAPRGPARRPRGRVGRPAARPRRAPPPTCAARATRWPAGRAATRPPSSTRTCCS